MLAAAWLLAAVELNGALISRGAQVQLSERDCSVEISAIAKALSAEHLADTAKARPGRCRLSIAALMNPRAF